MPSDPSETPRDLVSGRMAWAIVVALTIGLTAFSIGQALERYRALQTGWSWDLAYYNQWYWTLLFGDGTLSVRPIAAYANEGPEVWRTNYLSPLRYALIPVYRLAPGPETLLIAHAVVFWWVVPAAFVLARGESRSNAVGLAGAVLVPFTPLLWPLSWNDFREIQMALPFVLLGVEGVRSRRRSVAAVGILGMLACRQELAVVVATFALLNPRQPEDIGRSFRWRHALVVCGVSWILLGFFVHLRFVFGRYSVLSYVGQFTGPGAPLRQVFPTLTNFVVIGLGAWALFLPFAPRLTLLMLPWVWSLATGKWSLRYLATEEWHHVRYAAPFVAMGLAAGLSGFARVGRWMIGQPRGGLGLAMVTLGLAALSTLPLSDLVQRAALQPHPIRPDEVQAFWRQAGRVNPDDGVLAVYDVTAPLSSRRRLYSYILEINRPKGYPQLGPEILWVFYRNGDGSTEVFEKQGFVVVHQGAHLTILHRDPGVSPR